MFRGSTSTRLDVMSRYLVAEFCEQVYPCKSLVAGEQEQEYSARARICHPQGRTPVRGIRPFLLRVESRRPGQRQLARRPLQSENQGTKTMQAPTIAETEHPFSRGGKVMGVNEGEEPIKRQPTKVKMLEFLLLELR